MGVIVTLNDAEFAEGTRVGLLRVHHSRGREPSFAYADKEDERRNHILGSMGECAFCKVMGLVWPKRVNTFRSLPDVDPYWEVRTSPNPAYLKVRPNDDPDQFAVQVVGEHGGRVFTVVGFIYIREAFSYPKRDPGNRNRPAHFIPTANVTRIEELLPAKPEPAQEEKEEDLTLW